MVHHWISLINDKINKYCDNTKLLKIFKDENTYFYGDYDLDVFMNAKNEDKSINNLESIIDKVISNGNGWIRCAKREIPEESNYVNLSEIINLFGNVSSNCIKKMFPKKENLIIKRSIKVRSDGNFIMIACETEKFYYVFCFATS